jgi:hypothetical protein
LLISADLDGAIVSVLEENWSIFQNLDKTI